MSQNYLSSAEQRARAILDAYGSWPASWPADECQATLDCIALSPALQRYQAQLENLDLRIHAAQSAAQPATTEIQALQQRILASLPTPANTRRSPVPASNWRRLSDWLRLPRHALALVSIAILAIVLSMHRPATVVNPRPPAVTSFAAWSWYDITGQELPTRDATTALTMTDLVDLEINEDGG